MFEPLIVDQMTKSVSQTITKIINHPFNQGLYSGTLPKTVFIRYINQDKLYLHQYAQALNQTAIKLNNTPYKETFTKYTIGTINLEHKLHQTYPSSSDQTMIPAVLNYTNHLSKALQQQVAVSVASLLPCFWVYHELGKRVNLQSLAKNPYKLWLLTYSGKKFDESTQNFIDITNKLAQNQTPEIRQKMIKAFQESTMHELKFFDAIYPISVSENKNLLFPKAVQNNTRNAENKNIRSKMLR